MVVLALARLAVPAVASRGLSEGLGITLPPPRGRVDKSGLMVDNNINLS